MKKKHFKNWLEGNQDRIILTIGLTLVAFLAFGVGRLTAPIGERGSEIIFKQAGEQPTGFLNQQKETEANLKKEAFQGKFVGSKNSDKYHLPSCHWADRIKPKNRIWFKNEEY